MVAVSFVLGFVWTVAGGGTVAALDLTWEAPRWLFEEASLSHWCRFWWGLRWQ